MKKAKILIIMVLFLGAFLIIGVKSVLAVCQGDDDGLHSDAVKGGEEGFHPG